MKRSKYAGPLYSLLLGGTVGFALLFLSAYYGLLLIGVAVGEGRSMLAFIAYYIIPSFVMAAAYIISLWFTGGMAARAFLKNKTLLRVSFRYSLITNAICWGSLIISSLIQNMNVFVAFLIPIPLFAFCVLVFTFTIGLLISYMIKRKISIQKI